jgi:uncharacterized membrane protein
VYLQKTIVMSNTVTPWWIEEAELNETHETNIINVSWPERLVSVGVGAFMLSAGIRNFGRHPFGSLMRMVTGGYMMYRGASGNCPFYTAMGKTKNVRHAESLNIRKSVIVDKPRAEVYKFWRRIENLPLFMGHLTSVTPVNDTHSRWEAKFPGGPKIIWTAEIVNDEENKVLGWQSLPGSTIQNAGKVEFRDTPTGGTELRVIITYRPPAGDIGVSVAKLLNPILASMIEADIAEFIYFMEDSEPVLGSVL